MTAASDCSRWAALCDKVAIDEPVSASERQFLVEHVEHCADCAAERALWADLARPAAAPAPDPAEVARILRLAATPRPRPAARPLLRYAAGLAVAAGLGSVLVLWRQQERAPVPQPTLAQTRPASDGPIAQGPIEHTEPPPPVEAEEVSPARLMLHGAQALVDQRPARATQRLAQGQVLKSGGAVACLHLEPSVMSCLAPGGELVFTSLKVGQWDVHLKAGRLVSRFTEHPPGQRFSVHTVAGSVTAVGTVFAVDVLGSKVAARVHQGAVEVARSSGKVTALRHGQAFDVRLAKISSAAAQRAFDEQTLSASELWSKAAAEWAPVSIETTPARLGISVDGTEVGSSPLEMALSPGQHTLEFRRAGRVVMTRVIELKSAEPRMLRFALAKPGSRPPGGEVEPSASDLMRQARSLRAASRTEEAMDIYRQIIEAYPNSEEARLSQVSLGDLSLTVRPAQALTHYEAYLRTSEGALTLEARFGRIRALQALKRRAEARSAALEFVADYPSSMQARALAGELDAGTPPGP